MATMPVADQRAASLRLMDQAWAENSRTSSGVGAWRTHVANARAAVDYLRQAEQLPYGDPQVKQDLVYLLDTLAQVLVHAADHDQGLIPEALAAASEAVERQAGHVADAIAQRGVASLHAHDAYDTLALVLETLSDVRATAGLPTLTASAAPRHLQVVPNA